MNEHAVNVPEVHAEVALLLPWYVSGTLAGDERLRVEQHLRSCILCRRELAVESRTFDVFRNDASVDHSVIAGFERLRSRIDSAVPRERQGRLAAACKPAVWCERLHGWLAGKSPRPLLAAIPLALAAIAVALVLLLPRADAPAVFPGDGSPGYATLSSGHAPAAHANDIHVIFAPGTSAAIIDGVVETLPARVVDGPDNAGVYTIRLSNTTDPVTRQAAIGTLRAHQEVVFAETAQPMAVPPSAAGQTR